MTELPDTPAEPAEPAPQALPLLPIAEVPLAKILLRPPQGGARRAGAGRGARVGRARRRHPAPGRRVPRGRVWVARAGRPDASIVLRSAPGEWAVLDLARLGISLGEPYGIWDAADWGRSPWSTG